MKRCPFLLTILLIAGVSTAQNPGPVLKPLTIIRAGALIDGVSNSERRNLVITIRGSVITDVADAASATIPTGANVIDLS